MIAKLGRTSKFIKFLNKLNCDLETELLQLSILKKLTEMNAKSKDFEFLIADFFKARGFSEVETLNYHDGGIDLILHTDPNNIGLTISLPVQIKAYSTTIKPQLIQAFRGVMIAKNYHYGLFVTNGKFSSSARKQAENQKPQILVYEGEELAEQIAEIKQKLCYEVNSNE